MDINDWLIPLLTSTTSPSQKQKFKLNSRVIRFLGLLKVLKNHQKRKKTLSKILKEWNPKNEETYKSYENLFEMIKKRSKKKFYSETLQKFKENPRKTWAVIKEILGKWATKSSSLPTKITVNKADTFDEKNLVMHSINFWQTLELIWQIIFQMLQI